MPIVRYEGISPVAGIPLTVYLQGTQQPATIYADPLLTPLSNPFNVDGVTGDYVFYADDQVAYDLQLGVGTGTPIPPVTPDPAPYDAAYLIANPTPYPALPNARSPQDSPSVEWDYSIPGRIRAVATSEPATSVSPISVAGLVGVSLDYARADHTHAGVPIATPLVTWDSAPGLNGRQLIAGANVTFTGGAGQLILNAVGSGFGDVTGPASAQNLHIAVFSGLSGKLIADGGQTIAEVVGSIIPVDLTSEVSGRLPFANLAAAGGAGIVGAGAAGDYGAVALGAAQSIQLGVLRSLLTIGITIDGGGDVLTTGLQGVRQLPVAGTIIGWSILADQPGDLVITLTADDPASLYPPTTVITGSAPPTLTAPAAYARSTTLTGWTTAIPALSVIGFTVASVATITRATLQLEVLQ